MGNTGCRACLLAVLCALAGSAAGAARYRVEYATFVGGKAWDQAREIIVYPDGSALVGGMTASSGLPTTEGVVQATYGGEDPPAGHGGIFGGSKQERGVYGMALDSEGNIVIGSATRSPDLPTTEGCYQPKYGGPTADMYAAKLSPDMKKLLWCTYVGASKTDWPRGGLAVDEHDHVYLVGGTDSPDFPLTEGAFQRQRKGSKRDAAIVKLKHDGSSILWSTLLGGGDGEGLMGVQVDASGVYVAGHTQSRDFPVTPGAPQAALGGKSDCFFAKLSPNGGRLLYATCLGGKGADLIRSVALGPKGEVYLVGSTNSADFPVTVNAVQKTLAGNADAFIVKLVPAQ